MIHVRASVRSITAVPAYESKRNAIAILHHSIQFYQPTFCDSLEIPERKGEAIVFRKPSRSHLDKRTGVAGPVTIYTLLNTSVIFSHSNPNEHLIRATSSAYEPNDLGYLYSVVRQNCDKNKHHLSHL